MKKGFTLVDFLLTILALCFAFGLIIVTVASKRRTEEKRRFTQEYIIDKPLAIITSWSNNCEVISLVEQNGIRIYTIKDTKFSTIVVVTTNYNTITTNRALNDVR
jgi:hypothetical protein